MDERCDEAGRGGPETRTCPDTVCAYLRSRGRSGRSCEGERGEGEQEERVSAGFCVSRVPGYRSALLLYYSVETLHCLLVERGD